MQQLDNPNDQNALAHRICYVLVSFFVSWNIFTVVTVALPDSPVRGALMKVVDLYLFGSGLESRFMLFSPNVDTSNAQLTADVTMSDGSKVTWHYPSVSDMNLLERLFHDRYISYTFVLQQPRFRFLLPDTARHIARELYEKSGRTNLPKMVVLNFVWEETKPAEGDMVPKHGTTEILRYKVTPQDLQ